MKTSPSAAAAPSAPAAARFDKLKKLKNFSAPAGDDEPVYHHATATSNACKLCTPLGACLAFRGVEGCVPFLHGSQGCATYIRRYIISHFREPMDIAASNFSEQSAVFGGMENFLAGVQNVISGYAPQVIGIATTCLSETIGEDMKLLLRRHHDKHWREEQPLLVSVATPSFRGTHMDGFHAAVRELVAALADSGARARRVNIFPGMVSPADLRYLKEILRDFRLPFTLLPDYSDTLDGPGWAEYHKLPAGGTPLDDLRACGVAQASVEFGRTLTVTKTAGTFLEEKFSVPRRLLGLPVGLAESDAFFKILEIISGRVTPAEHEAERGRLVDALVDGHKYVAGKKAVIYGEEDLVTGLASFLCEIGVTPAVIASGGRSGKLVASLSAVAPQLAADAQVKIMSGVDFTDLAAAAADAHPDLLIGSSKGYALARRLGVPLVRVGFPIHDRVGGQRVLHLGYRGAQQLFDRVVNALLERKQEASDVGYSYL